MTSPCDGSMDRTLLGWAGGRIPAVLLGLLVVSVPATASLPSSGIGPWIQVDRVIPGEETEEDLLGLGSVSGYVSRFGSDLALDGDSMVVGSQYTRHSDNQYSASGTGDDFAFVYEREEDGTWTQRARLSPHDARTGDTFAYSVDLDAETGVVVAGNPQGETAHIFERSPTGDWSESATLHLPDTYTERRDLFGYSVAASGGMVVVGFDPDLFLYEKREGSWVEAGTLPGGIHVDLEGDTLATSRWDPATGATSFVVYTRGHGSWEPRGHLDPGGGYNNENTQPATVDLASTEDRIILGARIDQRMLGIDMESQGLGLNAVGSAWIYELVDGTWEQTADIPNPNPAPASTSFGGDVSIEGKHAVIGAPWDIYNGAGQGSGAAYTYQQIQDEWVLTSKLRNHDNGPYGGGDLFGSSVAIDQGIVVAGAPFDDQRRDGSPPPLDDDADVPGCVHRDLVWGCDDGEDGGSVYVFEQDTHATSTLSARLGSST